MKAPSVFGKPTQGHDVVRARKYKNPSDGLLDYSTIWKIEEDEDDAATAFGSVWFFFSFTLHLFFQGDIHWTKPVKLKSYESSKYLCIRKDKSQGKEENETKPTSKNINAVTTRATNLKLNLTRLNSKSSKLSARGKAKKQEQIDAEIDAEIHEDMAHSSVLVFFFITSNSKNLFLTGVCWPLYLSHEEKQRGNKIQICSCEY